jgi:hypothetical protein
VQNITLVARLGVTNRNFRATHTVQQSPANVTPFDIIIKADEDAPKIEGKSLQRDASFGEGNAILAPGISEGDGE